MNIKVDKEEISTGQKKQELDHIPGSKSMKPIKISGDLNCMVI